MHGAAGFYDIVEGHAVQQLPGYTAPHWGIATKDRYGIVELIPDFQRQIDDPSRSVGPTRFGLIDAQGPGDALISAAPRNSEQT
jgi:hypothetical protein